MRSIAAAFVALWLCGQAPVPTDHSGEKATLDIAALDSFGAPVKAAMLSIGRLSGGESPLPIRIKPGETEVGYGTYQLTASAPGFEPASQNIIVNEPNTAVVIALVPGTPEKGGEEPVIRGRLRDPDLATACRWIRFVPLFAPAPPTDGKVYRGEFVLNGLKPGRYAAVLIGPSGPCHVAEVTVEMRQTQSIVIQ
jgi:hypothetical protein